MRKCVLSNEMKPKKEMVRIVRSKEGTVAIDPTGKQNGRGAYVSLDLELVKTAEQSKKLNRALNTTIPDDFYERLVDHVDYTLARMELLNEQ